jgi:hypothetical protein
MFIGAIPQKLKQVFYQAAPLLNGRDVYIGCSGNFTFEQILTRRCQDARLFSNDIAMYSSMIGFALTERQANISVIDPEFFWLSEYINRPGACQIATFLLLQEMLKYEKQKSDFQIRMWSHYITNWEKLLARSMERVNKGLANIRVHAYSTEDVFDFFPKDGVCIGFLPTYVGGYEKLYKRLDEILLWQEKPAYGMLTTERREQTIEAMKQSDFILYDDNPRDDVPCIAQLNQPGKHDVYIYSNMDFERVLLRKTMDEGSPRYPALGLDEEIPADAVIDVTKTNNNVLNHYRAMYLKKGIQPASASLVYMISINKKLLGFAAFQPYSPLNKPGEVYLMSDFVVRSSRYPRLSKLMLMVVKCREVRRMIEENQIQRYSHIITTAFTKSPVSMKYRGQFKLVKRGDGFLNYRGEFNEQSLQGVTREWKKKYKQH